MMSSVGRINVDPAAGDDVFDAARQGDPAARWGALEACRAYLRLVVGVKGRRRGDGGPDTPTWSRIQSSTDGAVSPSFADVRPDSSGPGSASS